MSNNNSNSKVKGNSNQNDHGAGNQPGSQYNSGIGQQPNPNAAQNIKFTDEQLVSLRQSVQYLPKDSSKLFAQFLQVQLQQGNTQPSQMLRSAVQYNQEQQQQISTINQAEQAIMKRLDFSKSSHPTACFFHLIFKALALFTHIVLAFFINSLKAHYMTILFCTFDFWVVKNITGRQLLLYKMINISIFVRLLIGLRWWSEQLEDNQTQWLFECKINKKDINDFNFNIFWGLQMISTLVWGVLLGFNVVGLDLANGAVCFYGFASSFWNAYYFYKCNTRKTKTLLYQDKKMD